VPSPGKASCWKAPACTRMVRGWRRDALPLDGGAAEEIRGLEPGDRLVRWTGNGARLLVVTQLDGTARLVEVDPATGKRVPGKEITSVSSAHVVQYTQMLVSADGDTIVYGQNRRVRTLRVAEGLR